jgi:transposase
VARNRREQSTLIRSARRGINHWLSHEEGFVFIIGIDPHKGSHTAAVLDHCETVIGELRVSADRRQRDRLLEFAASFTPRTWAIEAASGLGALLAQQLVAAGETVLNVPPTLSARVRLLDAGCTDKTDPHDARAAAIVALRHARLRHVVRVDHTAVLRLLADRHHDLTGLRTQAICRLHALLCGLTPGGAGRLLSAQRAGRILRSIHPGEPVEVERKRIALELLGDVCRFDSQLVAINERIVEAVMASATTVTDIHGIGPLGAAVLDTINHSVPIATWFWSPIRASAHTTKIPAKFVSVPIARYRCVASLMTTPRLSDRATNTKPVRAAAAPPTMRKKSCHWSGR